MRSLLRHDVATANVIFRCADQEGFAATIEICRRLISEVLICCKDRRFRYSSELFLDLVVADECDGDHEHAAPTIQSRKSPRRQFIPVPFRPDDSLTLAWLLLGDDLN